MESLYGTLSPDSPVVEMASLCPSCNGQGMTRMMLTRIPYFKDVIVIGFFCDSCGFKSSDVIPGTIDETACTYELRVKVVKVCMRMRMRIYVVDTIVAADTVLVFRTSTVKC